jgi:hypothetical protein
MPKIPTYTAEHSPAIQRLPDAPRLSEIPVLRNSGAAMLAQGLGTVSEAATQVLNVAREIKQQKDETELIKQQYSYDPEIATIRKDVLTDPNVENPFIEFNDRAAALQQTYLDGIKDPMVKQAFQRHIDKTFPTIQKDMAFDVMKLQNQKNVADLHETMDILSTAAATGTPEVRDQAILDYNTSIDRARQRGTINPIEAVDFKKKFRTDVMTKNMTALALSDPYKMFEFQRQGLYGEVDPVVKQHTIQTARRELDIQDKKIEDNFKAAQKVANDYYFSAAMTGSIPEDEIELMAKGQHPYVTDPHVAASIIHQNANPVEIGDTKPVAAIMLDFQSRPKSNPDEVYQAAKKARAELDAYRSTLTKRDPSLIKAYTTIGQAELMVTTSQARERSEQRSEVSAARADRGEIKSNESHEWARQGQERIKMNQEEENVRLLSKMSPNPVTTVPMIDKPREIQRKADEAEAIDLVKKGWTGKDAWEYVQKKRKESEPISKRHQGVLDVAPKR